MLNLSMYQIVNLNLSGTRDYLRTTLITEFLKELPGKTKPTKYAYCVETLADSSHIYLLRSTILNKGFDFLIVSDNHVFSSKKAPYKYAPSHRDLSTDLQLKSVDKDYARLYQVLSKVLECDASLSESEYSSLSFSTGMSAELLVKLFKWIFIEQDITYWNWKGRYKTWELVKQP